LNASSSSTADAVMAEPGQCPFCSRAVWSLCSSPEAKGEDGPRHVGDGRGCQQTITHAARLRRKRSKSVPYETLQRLRRDAIVHSWKLLAAWNKFAFQ
jgi:hypothetical protein